MMVITPNHQDKLDPALTRPERVDTCLHFRKCVPAAILDIFYNFYETESLPDRKGQQVSITLWWLLQLFIVDYIVFITILIACGICLNNFCQALAPARLS